MTDINRVPELSKADQHILAVLRDRYGTEAIQQALPTAQTRKRGGEGRPPNPFKDFEAAHLADWIEDRIDENRASENKASVKEVLIEAYHMQYGDPGEADDEAAEPGEKERRKPPTVTSFLDRVKKKRSRGRALLRSWRSRGQ